MKTGWREVCFSLPRRGKECHDSLYLHASLSSLVPYIKLYFIYTHRKRDNENFAAKMK